MDKNTITGFVLIAALLIGFSWYNKPSDEEIAQQRTQDSIAAVEKKKAEADRNAKVIAAKATTESIDTTSAFHEVLVGRSDVVTLRNKKLEVTFNTKGATVEKAVIKGFKNYKGEGNVTLFDKNDQQLKFMLSGKDMNLVTSEMYFTPSNVTDTSVVFTAATAEGKSLIISYNLGKDYMLHASIQAKGMSGLFAPNCATMDVEWTDKCRQQEKGFTFENRYASLTYHKKDGGNWYGL